MARVLALAREPPYPLDAGDRVVTHGFLQALARRGHETHLLCYDRSDDEPALEALDEVCATVETVPAPEGSALPPRLRKLARNLRGRSDVMAMFDSPALPRHVAERVRELAPDVVLAEHPYMGQTFREDEVRQAIDRAGARPVTNAHVVEHAAHQRLREHVDGVESLLLGLEIPRLRRAEEAVYAASERTLVLSEADRRAIGDGLGPVVRQRVALDVDHYRPKRVGDEAPEPTMLFFGSYDWFPNEHGIVRFVERVLPRVRECRHDARLRIAGRDPTPDVRALGGAPGVEVLGRVDDLGAEVRRAHVVLAPLWIGGGVRLKVLESMGWGAPVVATPAGAEGVDGPAEEALAIAGNEERFADAVVELLQDGKRRARLGERARAVVGKRYALATVASELEANLGLDG